MQKYRVVGIMSGTSLDGVDIALCTFENKNNKWKFKIEAAETVAYTKKQKENLAQLPFCSAEVLAEENAAYGQFLGTLVKKFLTKNKTRADFVSSHGHTVFHQPAKKFTLQIGEGAALSAACGLPVVCDFRTGDVALGGQGAPLVPIGDKFLFSQYEYCLNLGGIANISFEKNRKRIAYDICPVNIILNTLAAAKGKSFDKGGVLAASGSIDNALLDKLNSVSFYKKRFPKSLGREDIEKDFLKMIEQSKSSVEDKLRTLCEHIALQISLATKSSGKMLITGGGTHNTFLIGRIKDHCKAKPAIPSKQIIEFKEALIFAFLGVLRWRNEVNCLSSVTGAVRDSSGGGIYHP